LKSKPGVSVIIPHGGAERLPHLTATLANSRQCAGVDEVIVVEMGTTPVAEDLARGWADKYVFVHHAGAFERAHALNIGLPYAEYDLLLWKDNDLLAPADFVSRAASELRARALDYLLPYTDISYLSAPDSQSVMAGMMSPADGRPVKLLKSQKDVIGGTGMVRKAFVLQYGGMPEGFRGWGGEDNVWSYKSRLLGRAAVTQQPDQHLFHLFHTHLGGYVGEDNRAKNPFYDENVALMYEMCAVRNRDEFMRRFPPPEHFSCPWKKEKRILFVADDSIAGAETAAEQIALALENLYDFKAERLCASLSDSELKRHWHAHPPDAIVLCGSRLAQNFLAEAAFARLRDRVLIVHDAHPHLHAEESQRRSLNEAVLTTDAATLTLRQAGRRSSACSISFGAEDDPLDAALALAQPLSVILGREDGACAAEQCAGPVSHNVNQHAALHA
jgi:hypothetical protein